MNAVFNALNDVTSELFMVFKEIKGLHVSYQNQILRRIKYFLDLIIDLSRILELLTRWVPELFLSKDQIHAGRLLDFILFVFRSVFRMQMDNLFIDFCNKLQTRSRTLPQFLVPFIGILTNLYTAISEVAPGGEDRAKATAIQAAMSLSPDLNRFNEILRNSSPPDAFASASHEQEERKGASQFSMEEEDSITEVQVESYSVICQNLPFNRSSNNVQFDSLADMINRMSSFDPSLFKRLLEIVLNDLSPGS